MVEANEPVFAEAQDTGVRGAGGQIDILLETAVPVSVSVGERDMEVREVLQLAPGSVVTLDRRLGQPVDVLLRGIRFATGHLVVVGDQMGVRLKEILPAPGGAKPASPTG
jgi:flagellar motor switch protein FliN/FliY